MLNFMHSLFRRPEAVIDDGEVSRLRQMRLRSHAADSDVNGDDHKPDVLKRQQNAPAPDAARMTIGRGNADQSSQVQQKWIDDCGFKKPAALTQKDQLRK